MPSAVPSLTLAYLLREVERPAAWECFGAEMLGPPAPAPDATGRLAWQLDDRAAAAQARRPRGRDGVAR